jgi:hypothetical protein
LMDDSRGTALADYDGNFARRCSRVESLLRR